MENKTLMKYGIFAAIGAGVILIGLGIWALTGTQPNKLAGIIEQPTPTSTSQQGTSTPTPSITSTAVSPKPTATPTPAGCQFTFIDPSVTVTSPCNGQKATKGFTFKATVPNIYSGGAGKADIRTYEVEIRDTKGNYMNWYGLNNGTVTDGGKTITYNIPMKYIRPQKTSHATVRLYLSDPMANTETNLAKIDIIVK